MKFQTNLDYYSMLSVLDLVVFFAILIITVFAVFWGNRAKKQTENKKDSDQTNLIDLLIMGRQLTLPLFVGTLVATWYGGIFGVTAIAFDKGIFNFVTQGFFWYVAYLLFAFLLVDKVSKYHSITLPEMIGSMFGRKSEKVSAIFNFFNVMPIAYVISVGIFIQTIFGLNFTISMILGTGFVSFYSMFGGFRAVVFSDFVQFICMCMAVAIVLVFSISTFGGISFLKANLPATHFSLTGGETLATTLVWGFIALSTLVDPNFYQRIFAAKSPKIAKKGIIISTIIWFMFDICTTAGGMYARAVIPEAESGSAYLIYALQLLPDGVRGFVLAGILATIISTLDSFLFIAGTTISYDLAPKRFKNKMSAHYFGIIFVSILAIILGYVFEGNIKIVWKTLGSYYSACLLLPVMIGHIYPKKISDNQFVLASILGVIGTSYWKLAEHQGFWSNVDELYIGICCTSFGLIIFPVKNYLFRKGEKI